MLRPRREVASVELDGQIVIYDDSTRRFHRLNPTASIFWASLDGKGSLAEIAVDIAGMYGAEVEAVLDTLVYTAGRFADEGLFEAVE